MHKYAISMLIGLAAALVVAFAIKPAPAQADEPLPGELAYIDADLAIFTPQLADYEEAYYATNNHYFQSLVSHNTPPSGATAPDNLYSHPEDQTEALNELWQYASLPEAISWSFRVDTYNGPEGDGYVLVVETSIDGNTWHTEINFGPETYRSADWFQKPVW